MIIDCIADLHGFKPKLPGGDLLILAGDYTAKDTFLEWADFFKWVKQQQYTKKILIAGNHDNLLYTGFPKTEKEAEELAELHDFLVHQGKTIEDFEYLCDSGTEYNGLKIWGTPWTPLFDGVNPKCTAFMRYENFLNDKFSQIPTGLDILITHGPMKYILDENIHGYPCGSLALRKHIDRAKPRFHVCGHIHEQGGNELMYKHIGINSWCINCSHVDENYKPLYTCIRIKV